MDDDETPRHRKTAWTDDQRADVGREHRTPTEIRLQRVRRNAAQPFGIPVHAPADYESEEITSPLDMLDRDPGPEVHELVRRSKRDSGAPATVEDFAALKLSIDRQLAKERSSSAEAKKVLDMLPSPEEIKEMRATQAEIRHELIRFKISSVVLKAAAVIALGAAGYVVDKIVTRLGTDGANEIRIEHLERAVDRVLDKLDRQPRPTAQKDSSP